MDQEHSFKLIDATYSPEEAREILLVLIKSKISFLNMKMFSIDERNSGNMNHLEKRREELLEARETYNNFLKSIDNDQLEINIDCNVNLTVKEKKEGSSSSLSGNETSELA